MDLEVGKPSKKGIQGNSGATAYICYIDHGDGEMGGGEGQGRSKEFENEDSGDSAMNLVFTYKLHKVTQHF